MKEKEIVKDIHIQFIKDETVFRFVNGKKVSDKERNRVVDKTKNPFIDLQKLTDN